MREENVHLDNKHCLYLRRCFLDALSIALQFIWPVTILLRLSLGNKNLLLGISTVTF